MTVPIGTILPYAGLVDGNARGELQRQGWLICDGEEYSEEEYPELENTIGTIYGNSRPGSFKVPDLRGRFVRGVDAGAGRDPDAGSRSGGHDATKLGSVQDDAFKDHYHWLYIDMKGANSGGKEDWGINKGTRGHAEGTHARRTAPASERRAAVTAEETRPKNIYVNWIIKAREV